MKHIITSLTLIAFLVLTCCESNKKTVNYENDNDTISARKDSIVHLKFFGYSVDSLLTEKEIKEFDEESKPFMLPDDEVIYCDIHVENCDSINQTKNIQAFTYIEGGAFDNINKIIDMYVKKYGPYNLIYRGEQNIQIHRNRRGDPLRNMYVGIYPLKVKEETCNIEPVADFFCEKHDSLHNTELSYNAMKEITDTLLSEYKRQYDYYYQEGMTEHFKLSYYDAKIDIDGYEIYCDTPVDLKNDFFTLVWEWKNQSIEMSFIYSNDIEDENIWFKRCVRIIISYNGAGYLTRKKQGFPYTKKHQREIDIQEAKKQKEIDSLEKIKDKQFMDSLRSKQMY